MSVKANMILDTRREKKDKNYPVKLRITYERKQRYHVTNISLNEDAVKKAMFARQTPGEKQTK